MRRIYLYPVWLRIWHWTNALLFLILLLSGISLHFSDKNSLFVPFKIAMLSHNICGILLTLMYLFFFIFNLLSGNIKYYIPQAKTLLRKLRVQTKYYLLGIFNKEPHPFHHNEKDKFNPLQKITYAGVMFFVVPIIIISGWFLLFPEYAPNEFLGMGGVWPMAILHISTGFLASMFMLGHIYLGTTGKTLGELYKSMISGWYLEDAIEEEEDKVQYKLPPKGKRLFPIVFYNPITMFGTLTAIISFLLILFLIGYQYIQGYPKAYLGIINFIVLPTILICGLLLIVIGIIRENRRLISQAATERKLPVIDLNNPKHQVATFTFVTVISIVLIFSVYGSFKAYEYMDSDEFCGTICHKVMQPEYTAYHNSPHQNVGCVKCHIGPGSSWFVKSKISGAYQVYSVLFNKYSRPIPTPIANLRPAQETCEKCHWPRFFYSQKKIEYDCYVSDENNTKTAISMLLKIGGGNSEFGNNSGIHYKMNIANEITYLATDKERMQIPWVKSRNLETGEETIYTEVGTKVTDDMLTPDKLRKFDCIDCHNRPSHDFAQPNKIVNAFLTLGRIDQSLPYIKNLSVQLLENYITSRQTAPSDIRNYLTNYYKVNYPNVLTSKQVSLESTIKSINYIYQNNYFPEMNANWKQHPNNIGHLYSPGCFRCHDGRHVSNRGKVISKDCNACHTIIYQAAPGQQPQVGQDIPFIHPGGEDKPYRTRNCADCHGVKKQ